jgi:hypothetical protein
VDNNPGAGERHGRHPLSSALTWDYKRHVHFTATRALPSARV